MGSNGPLGNHPRHEKQDYRMDSCPVGRGGQGQVFPAVHKATGIKVRAPAKSITLDVGRARFSLIM
ncbi:hypothetical protein SAMN05216174_110242 [Actinokineospora iranica]|uniref:Uncharacterized protein n=1 Tax=Actinokineospora iranica TaxID=1271860 RepID=A0A1G6UH05_9PSEU|nr:hypothetical protein SAMN05216174_110242 [Actinokineospora iranica]